MEFQLQRKKYKSPKFWTSDFCELCSFRNKMFEEAHILVPPVYQYIYSGEKKKKKIVIINSCLHMFFCWIDETPCLGKQFG